MARASRGFPKGLKQPKSSGPAVSHAKGKNATAAALTPRGGRAKGYAGASATGGNRGAGKKALANKLKALSAKQHRAMGTANPMTSKAY